MSRRQRGEPAKSLFEKRSRGCTDVFDIAAQVQTDGSATGQATTLFIKAHADSSSSADNSASPDGSVAQTTASFIHAHADPSSPSEASVFHSNHDPQSLAFVPDPYFVQNLPFIRQELLYPYSDPITGKPCCLFLSPWSTLGPRVTQFMRILRALIHIIARSSHAARGALCTLSLRRHMNEQLPVALCDDTPALAPHQENLDCWAAWLPSVLPDRKWAINIQKVELDDQAFRVAMGNEALCDVTRGKDLPSLLMTPFVISPKEKAFLPSPRHNPFPMFGSAVTPPIVYSFQITMAARLRMLSAAIAFVATRSSSSSAYCQTISQRSRISRVIVARVFSCYRAATEACAVHLFDSCLRKLRQAQINRQENSSVFSHLLSGNFCDLQNRLLRAGDVLLSREINLDFRTPLHYCAIFGNAPLAQALVAACAPPDARDKSGFSAITYAAMYDSDQVARVLIHAGADLNAAGKVGWAPLHFAAKQGSLKVLELLIAAGVHVNALNKYGSTALHVAAEFNQYAVARRLVVAGISVKRADCRGRTALHIACSWVGVGSCCRVVEALLNGGANVNEKDAKGCTALHHAAASKSASLDTVKALVAARADLSLKNNRGEIPLECARSNAFSATIGEYLRRVQLRPAGGVVQRDL